MVMARTCIWIILQPSNKLAKMGQVLKEYVFVAPTTAEFLFWKAQFMKKCFRSKKKRDRMEKKKKSTFNFSLYCIGNNKLCIWSFQCEKGLVTSYHRCLLLKHIFRLNPLYMAFSFFSLSHFCQDGHNTIWSFQPEKLLSLDVKARSRQRKHLLKAT